MNSEPEERISLSEITSKLRQEGKLEASFVASDRNSISFGRLKFALSILALGGLYMLGLALAFNRSDFIAIVLLVAVLMATLIPIILRLRDLGMSASWALVFVGGGIAAFFGLWFLAIPFLVVEWLLNVRLFAAPTNYAESKRPDRAMKIISAVVIVAGLVSFFFLIRNQFFQ